jgi:hypothetical protein
VITVQKTSRDVGGMRVIGQRSNGVRSPPENGACSPGGGGGLAPSERIGA